MEYDIKIDIKARIYPKEAPKTVAEQVFIQQEELKLNYYLDMLADILEKEIMSGRPIKDISQNWLKG